METKYLHKTLSVPRPKQMATTKKIIEYRASYGIETGSLRFFTTQGNPVNEKSTLYNDLFGKFFNKFGTEIEKLKNS